MISKNEKNERKKNVEMDREGGRGEEGAGQESPTEICSSKTREYYV